MTPFDRLCAEPTCSKTATFSDAHCRFHRLLSAARLLQPEELDVLIQRLADVEVLTSEERAQRAIDGALSLVRMDAKSLERDKARAITYGATQEQVEHTIATAQAEHLQDQLNDRTCGHSDCAEQTASALDTYCPAHERPRCKAVKRDGKTHCKGLAMKGSNFCRVHAGTAPKKK